MFRENRLFFFFEGLIRRLAVGNSFRKLENQQNDRNGIAFGVLQKLHWCSKCRTYNCEEMVKNVYIVYKEVMGEEDFHPHCSQKFFGTTNPPILDYTLQEMEMLLNKSLKLPLQFQEFSQNYRWASLKMF